MCQKRLFDPAKLAWFAKETRAQNLRRCAAGAGDCNYALLTPVQIADLRQRRSKRNLRSCLSGKACNYDLLSVEQQQDVSRMTRKRNRKACFARSAYCRLELLSADEILVLQEVSKGR